MNKIFLALLFLTALLSCNQTDKSNFSIGIITQDTVYSDSNYVAQIFLIDKPVDLVLDGFYFGGTEKLHQSMDTATLIFKATCTPVSVVKKSENKVIEKKYWVDIKGRIGENDTTIKFINSYYIDCK